MVEYIYLFTNNLILQIINTSNIFGEQKSRSDFCEGTELRPQAEAEFDG